MFAQQAGSYGTTIVELNIHSDHTFMTFPLRCIPTGSTISKASYSNTQRLHIRQLFDKNISQLAA
jgi:hypothetical protein